MMRQRVFRRLGADLTLEALQLGLLDIQAKSRLGQQALDVFRRLCEELGQGRLAFLRVRA